MTQVTERAGFLRTLQPMPDEEPGRFRALQFELAMRLRSACNHLPEMEFEALVNDLTSIALKNERSSAIARLQFAQVQERH